MFMRNVIRQILANGGLDVIGEAGAGKEAVDLYGKLKPDIVTMDLVMPGLDGIETIREIVEKDPEARVLMVSSVGQQNMVTRAIKAGAKGYVVKPFKPELLLQAAKEAHG